MRLAPLVIAFLVAGCVSVQTTPGRFSNPELCYYVYAGGSEAVAAERELQNRRFSCTPEAVQMGFASIQAWKDRNAAIGAASARMLATPPPRSSITCVQTGNITTCH
jgi:hypothetical protein